MVEIIIVETGHNKAYDLICQLHEALSFPVLERGEYNSRLDLAIQGGYRQYFIVKNDEIVGLIGFRILNDLLRPRRLLIDDLVIDKQYRKQGLSTKALDFAFEIARVENCQRVDLEAALSNDAAINTYKKYDFDSVAYLMRKMV
ncbi:MAG: hypothetical protein COB36_04175 [Alphaproteobacteria bacterium]|nr:MAG: hypothetical protein COB36_04175 [Alphaproteobacteria bacterium]